MAIGAKEAAARLQVGQHRVRALIRSGALRAELIGGRYIVDERSLESIEASTRPAHVRSFSRRVAWAAAALADGRRPGWLSQPELSRLRGRMDSAGADPATWMARMKGRASQVATYRAGDAVIGSLRHDQRLALSGSTATNLASDRQIAASRVQLWCLTSADRDEVVAAYGLLATAQGNTELRVADVQGLNQLGVEGNAFRLIVAADLLDGEDARARSAGRALLEATLRERRWTDPA
jgi:hypothetical protein